MTGFLSGEIDEVFSPKVSIQAGDARNSLRRMEFLLDTGFNDSVAVSDITYGELGRQPYSVRRINTAAGLVDRRTCIIYVRWDGSMADEVHEAIIAGFDAIGVAFLEGAHLEIDFIPGSRLSVTRPEP
jgi:predicted aspartyl protease